MAQKQAEVGCIPSADDQFSYCILSKHLPMKSLLFLFFSWFIIYVIPQYVTGSSAMERKMLPPQAADWAYLASCSELIWSCDWNFLHTRKLVFFNCFLKLSIVFLLSQVKNLICLTGPIQKQTWEQDVTYKVTLLPSKN